MNKEDILNEIINNTIKLIKLKTIKENYIEFDKAYEIVKKELKDYYIEEIIINNYKNLVISNTKDNTLDVIFCAHMDVVPCDKYEGIVKENNLCGRGSFDMKGQLSVIISLLKNNKSNKKIAFFITSDEEIGGYCCKEILKNYNSKLAVIPDAGKDFKLIVEEKGLLQLEIETTGITSHASEPFNGKNAILQSINIYNELLKMYKQPANADEFITSINLSKINGGSANNTVADLSKMVLDIRFTADLNKEKILNDIKQVAENSKINVLDYGPTFHVDEHLQVIKQFIKDSSSILEKEVEISKCVATSDAIYFSEKNIPTILINPIGDYWHNPKEYVNIESLYTLYCLFQTLL